MTDFVIEKATVSQAKAKIAFVGPAGSGKSYTALTTANELGKKILVIDTENKSSVKYAAMFDFDVLNLTEYKLTTYIAALEYAKKEGYDVVIVDSLSHAWVGPGGALDQVDQASGGNKFTSGWKVVTPLHNKLIETVLSYPIHLIATMRMKMDYILVLNEQGKQVPQKVGLGIVQRDGLEYEFDIVAEMSIDHHLTITKTRCFALDGFEADKPDGLLGQQIRAWLTEGNEKLLFPNGWYPTKEQFFAKARDKFDWSNNDIAQALREAGFTAGFDALNAAKMWNVIQEVHSSNQDTTIEMTPKDAFFRLAKLATDVTTPETADTISNAIEELTLPDEVEPGDSQWIESYNLLLEDVGKVTGLDVVPPQIIRE